MNQTFTDAVWTYEDLCGIIVATGLTWFIRCGF